MPFTLEQILDVIQKAENANNEAEAHIASADAAIDANDSATAQLHIESAKSCGEISDDLIAAAKAMSEDNELGDIVNQIDGNGLEPPPVLFATRLNEIQAHANHNRVKISRLQNM